MKQLLRMDMLNCGFPGGSDGKESACKCRRSLFNPWKSAWSKEWLPTPVFLPEELHGQRSLKGYPGVTNSWIHWATNTRLTTRLGIIKYNWYFKLYKNDNAFKCHFNQDLIYLIWTVSILIFIKKLYYYFQANCHWPS